MNNKAWYQKPSAVVLLLLTLFSALCTDTYKNWGGNNSPFFSDVDQYYSFLIAYEIHDDLSFNFPNQYWLHTTETGAHVPKVSLGMSLMYAPFFYAAHFYTQNFSTYPADGYSHPYIDALVLGGIFYTLLGLYFLRKSLLHFFNEWPIALTLITLYLATNLLHYTLGWGLMTHNYLFLLFALILYATIKWHESLKLKYMFLLGFSIGLAVVVRPAELFVVLIPLLYNITSFKGIKEKLLFFKQNEKHLFYGFLFFMIPILPQLIYWKWATDSFLHYSYGDTERFFFGDPKIFDFLFSYRKGWFVYTPIMIFSIVGFIWRKKINAAYFSVLIFTLLSVYLLSSWWCWWFGGGFGMRAMIQSYAFLALPLTAFFAYVIEKKYLKILSVAAIIYSIYFNMLHMYQYKYSTLHYDSMTKEVFWKIYGKWQRTDEIIQFCEKHYVSPDYEKARAGIR